MPRGTAAHQKEERKRIPESLFFDKEIQFYYFYVLTKFIKIHAIAFWFSIGVIFLGLPHAL
jgi:hypothetical protein